MTVILSPALFPPVEYMALLLFHPDVKIEAHEHYQKQSYRTRFNIVGPNGIQLLQVPVSRCGEHRCSVQHTAVLYEQPWPVLHLRTLDTAYNKSPWYLYYKDPITDLFKAKHDTLWNLCIDSIQLAVQLLGASRNLAYTETFLPVEGSPGDFRNQIHPKKVFAPFARAIRQIPYHQVFSERFGFVPHLSVLDLLFNEGPQALPWLHKYYSLIQEGTI